MGLASLFLALTVIVFVMLLIHNKYLKVLNFKENKGEGELSGQFKTGATSAYLPNMKGLYKYTVTIDQGCLRLYHISYNPDGTWTMATSERNQSYYELKQKGTYSFIINLGQFDKLELVNLNYHRNVKFRFVIEAVWS